MNPDPAPVDGTENGVTPEIPFVVMVTTEGVALATTLMIASVWVMLIACAVPGWDWAVVTAAAGREDKEKATYVPAAESEPDSRAAATTIGQTRRTGLTCLGGRPSDGEPAATACAQGR